MSTIRDNHLGVPVHAMSISTGCRRDTNSVLFGMDLLAWITFTIEMRIGGEVMTILKLNNCTLTSYK